MKTVYINNFPPPEFYSAKNWSEKLKYLAVNTGNWIFITETRKQIDFSLEGWFFHIARSPENYSSGIMPCSNILRTGFESIIAWADLIEKVKFPITLVGMGTQSIPPDQYTPKQIAKALKPDIIKAFQRIAAQTCSLGVRGAATAEVLDCIGIHNYRIIGCPSFYQYLDGKFIQPTKATKDKVVFNLVPGKQGGADKIFSLGMNLGGQWIMQEPAEGAKYLFTKEFVDNSFVSKVLKLPCTGIEVNDYIKENSHIFLMQKDWDEYLEKERFSFSFGMRFHGNMLSYLHNIPSLWVIHDLRTMELVETLGLPHITLEEFKHINDIEELIARCNYDKVEKNYLRLCENYVSYLEENGIQHFFSLPRC